MVSRHPAGALNGKGGEFAQNVDGRDNIPTSALETKAKVRTEPPGEESSLVLGSYQNYQNADVVPLERIARDNSNRIDFDDAIKPVEFDPTQRKAEIATKDASIIAGQECDGRGGLTLSNPNNLSGQTPIQIQCSCQSSQTAPAHAEREVKVNWQINPGYEEYTIPNGETIQVYPMPNYIDRKIDWAFDLIDTSECNSD